MNDDVLINLINPEFTFNYMGEIFRVRKAALDKAIQYQVKAKALSREVGDAVELKLLAYCIFIMLKDKIPTLTEEEVLSNVPGDIDVLETLTKLGFMSPKKLEQTRKLSQLIEKKLTMENSSQISRTEPDGPQTKSAN